MHIFLTGGSGFVGRRVLARLTAEGHRVTALSRSPESDAALMALGAEVVRGDMTSVEDFAPALADHEAIVHAAAPVDVWGPRERFQGAIVAATKDLHAAATRHRVARFIHISSESVLQDRAPLLDIDETAPYPPTPNSAYGEAKRDIERWLRERTGGPHVVLLRPPYIWGAGNRTIDDIAARARSGQFVWIDGGKVPIEMVHVDNVVEATISALTRGEHGAVYIVTDDRPMSAKAFLKPLLAARGVALSNRSARGALARPAAAAVEAVWHSLQIKAVPPVSRFLLDFVGLPRRYRIDRAKRDLGYRPVRTLEDGLAEVVAWSQFHARRHDPS
ncbi:MAG: NAD(P)-dependent oxidoreductase [Gammaproteobacteria bacterium]|nr:NAD(P)-dependent oxidoreductase [Gammaproteobacteria bacterium]